MNNLRKHIIENLTAVQFYGALSGVRSTDAGLEEFNFIESNTLNVLAKFPNWGNPTSKEVLKVANQLKTTREKYYNTLNLKQHSSDNILFEVYRANYEDFFSKGISLFELQKVVDIESKLKYGYFLQTYILTDVQASNLRCSVAEFLQSSQHFYNEAWMLYNEKKKVIVPTIEEYMKIPETERARFQPEGELKIRYFKEAFINLILFVESFVNAVGYDAYLKKTYKNETEELNLLGKKPPQINGRISYLSIKDKFKIIPKIINPHVQQELNLDDEPYKTYFGDFVELRNSYMHTSPAKMSTWFSAEDWKNKNDNLIDNICFQVIEGFWNACYPNQPFPSYLKKIYYTDNFLGREKKYLANPI